MLVFADAEDRWDEGDGVGVFRCAGVGVVVGADVAVPVVVDGLEGEESMPPVRWDVGWCGWPGWDGC